MMKKIVDYCLKKNVAIIVLALLVVAAGLVSTQSIKVETYPDVDSPTLMIQGVYHNHSSEEIEKAVTTPVEEAIEGIKPYDSLTSTTRENSFMIQVTYEFGENMDEIESSIQSSIGKMNLPDEVDLSYKRISASAKPIYKMALSDENLEELQRDVNEDLLPSLTNVPGVSEVNLSGTTDTKLFVEVDKEKSRQVGLTASDVAAALEKENVVLPVGSLENGGNDIPVSLEGHVGSIEQLKETPIPVASKGAQPVQSIALSDIAEVKEVNEANAITRYNGDPAIIVEVLKSQDANTAEVVEALKTEWNHFNKTFDYDSYTIIDQGKEVEKSVESLLKEGGFGALFTVVIILLFLRNTRATLIAILSLPLSILGTIAVLDYLGYSLNIMTLGGMAVAIGRIVDDSIVVIENIYKWLHKEESYTKREIILNATREVIGAVTSSTIATVVVFLPLAFVGGIVGEFFRPFSIAVVTSIILSLLVAFMVIPVLGFTFLKKGKQEEKTGWLAKGYDRILRKSLSHKWVVITVSIFMLAGALAMVPGINKSFLPSGSANALELEVELPVTTSLSETDKIAKDIEAALMKNEEVEYVQGAVGIANNSSPLQMKSGSDSTATFSVQLSEGETVEEQKDQLEETVSDLVKEHDLESTIRLKEIRQEGPPSGKTIDITLYGENPAHLTEAADKVENLMEQNDQLTNISNTAAQQQKKIILELKEEAKKQGMTQQAVYQQVQEQMNARPVGSLELEEEVWVSYDTLVTTKQELEDVEIITPSGIQRLSDIAVIKEQEIPATIEHKDTKSAYTLSAESEGEDVGKVTEDIKKDLEALSLPSDIEWKVGGGQDMMTDGFKDLGQAMIIAVGLVFLTLTITYGGIITPLVILSSIIFVPIGSLGALMLTGETLSMSSMIGMLMLIGIVVTNAVVMLDRVESNRREGMKLEASLIEACNARFRPILMTALATILALMPLALSHSSSGVISKGLAITVIGGLTTSTLLTLVFIPVLYRLLGRWRKL
ncbi:efflux RND transporter permease subunit [Rossellomorea aquimaris]|uniref:efflux RND transporter permease subunit n=1 Tax=Rossellomorea aquimaris TaxID=189382 RepID=UPI001CD2C4F1|nr:efflux RND transporter permease subunit [Rossellomorea aquimaris]MCA1060402.1 efflux RND transporter permease subunit [Rossellomorea aquimaris]